MANLAIITLTTITTPKASHGLSMADLEAWSGLVQSNGGGVATTAVLIQKETGGNLAEIFERISQVIRSRFRFGRRVRTLSAEGRLSAQVVTSSADAHWQSDRTRLAAVENLLERRADERLWSMAQTDPRMMADLQAALTRSGTAPAKDVVDLTQRRAARILRDRLYYI